MAETLVIRRARREDAGSIYELICGLAEYEKLAHEVTGSVADVEVTLFGENPKAEVLIGEFEGLAVGFALFFGSYSTFLCRQGIYLEDLYVRPEFRGRGFGLALISAVAKVAVSRGCGRMEWSVLDWNEPAIAFYRGLGAEGMEGWTVQRVSGEGVSALAGASGVGVSE